MTTQNQPLELQFNSNPKVAGSVTCTCDICSPGSWERLLKHLDAKISHEEKVRLSGSVIPGGCFGPRVLKHRYEEVRKMHSLGIFKGF